VPSACQLARADIVATCLNLGEDAPQNTVSVRRERNGL
jgi:hypothetical protein